MEEKFWSEAHKPSIPGGNPEAGFVLKTAEDDPEKAHEAGLKIQESLAERETERKTFNLVRNFRTSGNVKTFCESLNKLESTSSTPVVATLIDDEIKGEYGRNQSDLSAAIVENIEIFENIDRRLIAEQLLKGLGPYKISSRAQILVKNLEKFNQADYFDIAQKIIHAQHGECVAKNVEKFTGVDSELIAKELVKNGDARILARSLEKFPNVDRAQLVEVLAKTFNPNNTQELSNLLPTVEGVDYVKIVDLCTSSSINTHYNPVHALLPLENCHNVDYQKVFDFYLSKGWGNIFFNEYEHTRNLDDRKVIDTLLGNGYFFQANLLLVRASI